MMMMGPGNRQYLPLLQLSCGIRSPAAMAGIRVIGIWIQWNMIGIQAIGIGIQVIGIWIQGRVGFA